MKVLVTGAAGFIGSHVTRLLRERGDEVVAVIRPRSPAPRLAGLEGLRIEEVALEDSGAVDRLFAESKPDAVVHLAWYAKPADYLVSPENVESMAVTARLARSCFTRGCGKLVVAGTCLEYAPADRPVTEEDPAAPASVYASAKHGAHLTARAMAASAGAELSWGRIFHLFGPEESPARLIPMVLSSLRSGKPIDLTAGEQVRDYLHVRDVASALVAMTRPGAAGVVNVCSGNERPLSEVLELLAGIVGSRELLRFGARPYGKGEVMYLAGRSDRLEALGWSPRFETLEAGLRDLVESSAETR